MHYRHAPYGLPNVAGVEPFLALWPADEIHVWNRPVLSWAGDRGVLVLKFLKGGKKRMRIICRYACACSLGQMMGPVNQRF